MGGVSFGCLGSITRVLLDTTRFLLIKSFKPLDNSASTGYAHMRSRYLMKSSVQHVLAVHTSAESSPVRLFLLLIQSFQELLDIGYILTEPSSQNWCRSHDIGRFFKTLTSSRRYGVHTFTQKGNRRTVLDTHVYVIHPVSSPIAMVMASMSKLT